MALMPGYTDTIRRYAVDSRRAGRLDRPDGVGEVGLGEEAGKRLAARFFLKTEKEKIEKARFEVFGCGFTIAACAAAAELAEGREMEEAAEIDPAAIDAVLQGLPAERSYCAELAAGALQAALAAARDGSGAVRSALHAADREDHGAGGSSDDPVYALLVGTRCLSGVAEEDRHLFACLLAAAAGEPHDLFTALGLSPGELSAILAAFFPGVDRTDLEKLSAPGTTPPPEVNAEVRDLLLSHVPRGGGESAVRAARWLARALAARAAHPGHLWKAMGLFERPELTAAIRRHLPSLAAANAKGMRWKRYLFKQVCDLHGAMLCKSPDCGTCSDYALCFAPEEEA